MQLTTKYDNETSTKDTTCVHSSKVNIGYRKFYCINEILIFFILSLTLLKKAEKIATPVELDEVLKVSEVVGVTYSISHHKIQY